MGHRGCSLVGELGADVDDAAVPCLHHRRQNRPRAEEDAAQVHAHHVVPHLQGHPRDLCRGVHAGVVHQYLRVAQLGRHAPKAPFDLVGVANIGLNPECAPPAAVLQASGRPLCAGTIPIDDGDIRALLGKELGDGESQSARAARHDGHLAVKGPHVSPSDSD